MDIISSDIKFIREILPKFEYPLSEIEKYAIFNHIPIIKPEVASFLSLIIKTKQPKSILEIGSAIGYSTIIMAKSYDKAHIVTVERDMDRVQLARENFDKVMVSDRVEIICGEGQDVLPNLNNKYDLIFVDASKGHYKEFYEEAMRLLDVNGIFICDNILYKGHVVNEVNVKHKRRTIVYRMREFIEILKNNCNLTTAILPLGDGLSVSIKEEKQ